MTDKITQPVPPDVTAPVPLGTLAGDWHDDDASVYEADFDHGDVGPDKFSGVPHPKPSIKPNTRLLTRTVTVGTVNASLVDPIQIIPADPNRQNVSIVVSGAAATSFRIGAEKTDCYNGNDIPCPSTNAPIVLNLHTGALWAYSISGTPVIVSVIAVTS